MFDAFSDLIQLLFGAGEDDINVGQMIIRALVTFVVTVVIIRFGDKRMFGKGSAFDIIIAIMIGSILSRAITGNSPLFATWVAGLVLVGFHWLLAFLSSSLDWFGPLVKGNETLLVKDGTMDEEGMRKSHITRNDLKEAMRAEGNEGDLSSIHRAYLERDGSISLVSRPRELRILEVKVEDGVQTLRIAVE